MDQAAAKKVAEDLGFKWANGLHAPDTLDTPDSAEAIQAADGYHKVLWNHAVSLQSRLDKMEIALRFAKEVIDDQAERFHKGCRCQLCESAPMLINDALGIEGAEVVNWTDPPKEQK